MKIQSISATIRNNNNATKKQSFKSLQITPKGMTILADMFCKNPETEIKFNKYIAGRLKNLKTHVFFDGFVPEVQFKNSQGKFRYLNPCPPFITQNSKRCGYIEEGWKKEIELAPEIMPKIKKDKETYQDFVTLSELEQARCIAEHFELKNGGKLQKSAIEPCKSTDFEDKLQDLYSKFSGDSKPLSKQRVEELHDWYFKTEPKPKSSGCSNYPSEEEILFMLLGAI